MMVGDPVRSGLVANFARPGGNITGYTVLGPEIAAKRLHPLFSGIQKTRPMPPMNGSISKARAAPEGRGFSCAPQAASCALSQSLPRFLRLRPHRAEWRRHAARSARGPQGHACIIDGEAVACDDNGVASFDLIRHHRANESIFLCAFDLIELNGDDLRRDPLEVRSDAPTRRGHATHHAIGGARRCRPTQCSYKEPGAFPSCSSSGNNSALDFPSRNPRSTAGHRSGIPCRASQRHPRNALPISSSALRLSTPRASSAFTVSRTSSFSRIKLRATLAISLLGPGMAPVLEDNASRKTGCRPRAFVILRGESWGGCGAIRPGRVL